MALSVLKPKRSQSRVKQPPSLNFMHGCANNFASRFALRSRIKVECISSSRKMGGLSLRGAIGLPGIKWNLGKHNPYISPLDPHFIDFPESNWQYTYARALFKVDHNSLFSAVEYGKHSIHRETVE